jgi:pyrroloquinoline-quinone synthase
MPLDTETVLNEIAELHRKKPYLKAPVWQELCAGSLSREQLKVLIKQNGIIPLHNHNYHGRLYVVCPDPKWRARIAEVVYEEGTGRLFAGGKPHNELYLQLGEGVGVSREEMWATDYCAGALAWKAHTSYLCGKSFLEGVSQHMLAGEAPVPTDGVSRYVALRDIYKISDLALEHFVVHQKADKDHSSVGFDLLDQFAKTEEDRRLVIRTVSESLDMFLLMYRDIHRVVHQVN